MKVVWNTCDKELGGEMKPAYENYLLQKFTWKLTKVTFFLRNFCKIFRVKQFTAILLSFHYQFPVRLKAFDTHSIHL